MISELDRKLFSDAFSECSTQKRIRYRLWIADVLAQAKRDGWEIPREALVRELARSALDSWRDDPIVVGDALFVLGRFGDPGEFSTIKGYIESDNINTARAAIFSISRICSDQTEALLDRLEAGDRRELTDAIGGAKEVYALRCRRQMADG